MNDAAVHIDRYYRNPTAVDSCIHAREKSCAWEMILIQEKNVSHT